MDRREVRRAWDEVSETYARRRDPTGSDADLLDDLLTDLPPNPDVLDVGCGDGARTLANLPAGTVGIDFSREGLGLAVEKAPDARLVQADMTAIPCADDSFDAVTAYYAVFHVPLEQQAGVYREMARVLRPGGRLLATLPSGSYETVRRGWMGGEMYFATPGRDRIRQQVTDAGFTDVTVRTAADPFGGNATFLFATRS